MFLTCGSQVWIVYCKKYEVNQSKRVNTCGFQGSNICLLAKTHHQNRGTIPNRHFHSDHLNSSLTLKIPHIL